MSSMLAVELRKLRATPTMWWLAAAVVALGIAATGGAIVLDHARHLAPTSDEALRDDFHSAGAGAILVVVAGIISLAGEFRFGQADQTFLSFPRRRNVVLAKVIVLSGLGAIFGLMACTASVVTTAIWLSTQGEALPLGREVVWSTIGGAVASSVLFGALGVAIGGIVRQQVAAIVGALAWFIVLEPITMQLSTQAARFLPGNAAMALRRVPQEGLLTMGAGGAVLAVWVLAAVIAGTARTAHTDIA